MQEVLDIRQARAAQGQRKEQAQARRYWEGRKGELGITATQPMAHKLYAIREARASSAIIPLAARWWTLISAGQHRSLATASRRSIIRQTQKSYGNVAPKHQVRFRTEREAQQAGYRRAANDHYGAGTGVARTARTRAVALLGSSSG